MNQQADDPSQSPADKTGCAQPPASDGPPGAFVDRQPATPSQPLPPGAGAPLQPGPPISVQAPIHGTTFNLGALALAIGIGIAAVFVVVLLLVVAGALLRAQH